MLIGWTGRIKSGVKRKRSTVATARPLMAVAPSAPATLSDVACARFRGLLLGGILIALTVAAYHPVLSAGYLWDDNVHFRDNTFMRDWSGLKEMWLSLRQTANPIAFYPAWHRPAAAGAV